MRTLTGCELETVAGGDSSEVDQAMWATFMMMAICPTPLVVAVGGAALLYYVWC
ncbi:MAG TPA: hypothetical protein VFV10_09825 [Gammaproteobacteria bacterium]|nr:hypothetical protein [Gammaproteobacteria bacterium]